MSNPLPLAPALRPDGNSRQLIPGTRGARPSRFSVTRTLGASLVAIVAMVLCASRASGQVTDALWAWSLDNSSISVCQNPTDPASISSCFAAATQIAGVSESSTNGYLIVTDGTNVYMGDYRCPVADFGQNCTKTQIGWGGFVPASIAAANGYLWLGSPDSMSIYRCPSNLPFTNATSMPTECELLATPNVPYSSKSLGVYELVYANGKLYVGVASSNGSSPSYLFSCDPNQTQDCTLLDMIEDQVSKLDGYCYGGINALAVGSGYVWVGLIHTCDSHKNLLLRCDPVAPNSCQTWDTPAEAIGSLADDGQGNLRAAVRNPDPPLINPTSNDDVVWSCPTTSANSCTNVLRSVQAWWVTAGAGHGFSSIDDGKSNPPIFYEGTPYQQSVAMISPAVPQIVYVPAGGAVGLGGVKVNISPPAAKVARVCAWRGTLPATIHVKGPHKLNMTRRFNLCDGRSWVRKPTRHFNLLHPGTYSVRVRSSEFSGTAEVEVTANRTARLAVKLRAPRS